MTNTTTPAGTLEHLDPNALIVEPNIRTVAPLDDGFVASIRENGVLTPILAWRDSTGGLNVRAGQRRTLAAREAEAPTVPVYVVDAADEDTARRIVQQLIENDQREALTDADRVQAWKALELDGLSAAAIAKRTGTNRDRVRTGLVVAASETMTGLVADAGLTLDQAAILLEFDGDDETVAALTDIATTDPGYFPVAVQEARNDREAKALREQVEHEHAAKGHRILSERPAYNEAPYELYRVRSEEGGRVTREDVDGKPGVAVMVRTWGGHEAVEVSYYLDDPEALSYTLRIESNGTGGGAQSGPMTDEQKAERKTLIANNKQWDAAETVRREWVASFLSRKTLPKNAQTVIAQALTAARFKIGDALNRGNAQAHEFLGLGRASRDSLETYLAEHPTHATRVTVAIVLGGIEQHTDRDTWRNPREDTAWYLNTLADWGYPLCPVERIAAKLTTGDEDLSNAPKEPTDNEDHAA